MARLINVPVMHSSAEMGSAAAGYQAAFVARHGERKWAERTKEFDSIWSAIGTAVGRLGLDLHHVKLYQDSLPICGKEAALVADLAERGSHNHKLLQRLMAAGATLVGTESPALLVEEYRLLGSPEHCETRQATLLEQRDRFIAGRINETLGPDETGLLFMGALHHVSKYLPFRIRAEDLMIQRP